MTTKKIEETIEYKKLAITIYNKEKTSMEIILIIVVIIIICVFGKVMKAIGALFAPIFGLLGDGCSSIFSVIIWIIAILITLAIIL